MILRMTRMVGSSAFIYLFYRVGYPEPGHQVYHMLVIIGILGVSGILTFGLSLVSFASVKLPLLLEAVYAAALVVVLGFTMPAKGGPALPQLLNGKFPTQGSVSEGLAMLGVDPKSEHARKVVEFFPR